MRKGISIKSYLQHQVFTRCFVYFRLLAWLGKLIQSISFPLKRTEFIVNSPITGLKKGKENQHRCFPVLAFFRIDWVDEK